ncbi:hypothetical protein TWF694_006174 [Orbilia ellipsospora]|uniref:Uncharacterized protein n=1 Tax=Orbilia ellipsospora TaxID=2528407 RepID=A0AAV9WRS3_9PEZI
MEEDEECVDVLQMRLEASVTDVTDDQLELVLGGMGWVLRANQTKPNGGEEKVPCAKERFGGMAGL